jgi:CDP-paratose 2-epimerase
VGSHIALALAQRYPDREITIIDNLSRKGSELNIPRLERAGVTIMREDVRNKERILELTQVELIVDCAAEPSVLAGHTSSLVTPRDLIDINFGGTLNCLELAQREKAGMIFISTSRVYPIDPINSLPFVEQETRFVLETTGHGASPEGISEQFTLEGTRSLYGATKLCSEHIAIEYAALYGLDIVINRAGVIAGPWQFGKTDQGVVALWVARHLWNQPLSYIGFGGSGKQVRDILHVEDMVDAILWQIEHLAMCRNNIFQIGGGAQNAVSLRELTGLCQEITGHTMNIRSDLSTRPNDLIWYISDHRTFSAFTGWHPKRDLNRTIDDIADWLKHNKEAEAIFA